MKSTPCYCINLRNAANAATKIYDAHLQPYGITIRQYSLLKNLGAMGCASVTGLAGNVGLDRTSVVRIIRPLLQLGLIEDKSAKGARDKLLCLTKNGEDLVCLARNAWEAAQEDIEGRIGKDNMSWFVELLEALL